MMENKALLITTIVGAIALIFAPVAKHEHVKAPKDEITVQAERYLEDLREFNQHAVDSINEKVDSLEHIKPKFRYIYKVIKADTNGTSIY
jgi:hypothetical protein